MFNNNESLKKNTRKADVQPLLNEDVLSFYLTRSIIRVAGRKKKGNLFSTFSQLKLEFLRAYDQNLG